MNRPFGGAGDLGPVELPNIPDPALGTPEYEFATDRDESTRSVAAMPWLPQLPEVWAQTLHDRIEAAERAYAAPNLQSGEYVAGTATEPDEIAVVRRSDGSTGYLFPAEHATTPATRKAGGTSYPDAGTGGLAAVLAEDYGTALILRGRQQSNFPTDPEHPLRPLLREQAARASGFLSVHGKNPGMFVYENDRAEIHACIGLGENPTEPMIEFAKKLVAAARDDLGLYLVVSNLQKAYIQKPNDTAIKRLDDGTPKFSQLAALNPGSSTNEARRALSGAGRSAIALQMEMTNLLRVTPLDTNKKDRVSRVIGVAMGYKLFEKAVELAEREPLESV